jgi:hypothetical protein
MRVCVQAVKLYDAMLHQAIYHYDDSCLGGFSGENVVSTFKRYIIRTLIVLISFV